MNKKIFLILSIIYALFLIFIFSGEVCYRLEVFNRAVTFNPLNAEYRSARGDIRDLKAAIEFDPLTPAYHMYYGLALLEDLPGDKFSAQMQLRLARKEISDAARLKPYSRLYQKIYADYSAWINSQF